jgi:phage terminase large subunit GpA-like protein
MNPGAAAYQEGFKEGLRPDPKLTVTQWADEYRILPRKSSSEPGRYRSSRTPWVREIGDCLSPSSPVQEICVMKCTQVGLTELGNNFLGYVVDMNPGPFMFVLPTVELAKDHSKQKLAPTIEETPRLRGKIKAHRSRDSGNTIQTKEFPGGILFLSGSNSPASFRAKSIRFLVLDDIDGYPPDVGGEGDPVDLAKKRTDSYSTRKKILEISTPTEKGNSRIEKSFEESDQRYYHVPCPFCGEMQPLEWGGIDKDHGIKFKRDDAGLLVAVWYQCRACGEGIDEHHKTQILEQGEWIATYPERKKRGYHLSALSIIFQHFTHRWAGFLGNRSLRNFLRLRATGSS